MTTPPRSPSPPAVASDPSNADDSPASAQAPASPPIAASEPAPTVSTTDNSSDTPTPKLDEPVIANGEQDPPTDAQTAPPVPTPSDAVLDDGSVENSAAKAPDTPASAKASTSATASNGKGNGVKPNARNRNAPKTRIPTSYKSPTFNFANAGPVKGVAGIQGLRDNAHRAAQRERYKRQFPARGFFKPEPEGPIKMSAALPPPGPYLAPKRTGWPLKSLHFGFVDRDGVFHAEYDSKLKDGHIEAAVDSEFLQITGEGFATNVAARMVVTFDALEEIRYDASPDASTCLLALVYAPSFEVYKSRSPRDVVRVIAYDETHRAIAPYVSRHLLLRAKSPAALNYLVAGLKRLPLPNPRAGPIDVLYDHLAHYDQRQLQTFRARLSALRPSHAFQLEAILHDGSLVPSEFVELEHMLAKLENELRTTQHDLQNDDKRLTDLVEQVLVDLRKRLAQDRFKRTRAAVDLANVKAPQEKLADGAEDGRDKLSDEEKSESESKSDDEVDHDVKGKGKAKDDNEDKEEGEEKSRRRRTSSTASSAAAAVVVADVKSKGKEKAVDMNGDEEDDKKSSTSDRSWTVAGGSDSASESASESEDDTGSESGTGSDSDSGSESGSDSASESDSESGSASESGSGSSSGSESESEEEVRADETFHAINFAKGKSPAARPLVLQDELDASVYAVLKLREQMNLLPDENHFFCRHVYITPSGRLFDGPFVEQSNSVMRKFPQATDFFLRVSFVEEDRTSLQLGRWGISKDFLTHHVYAALTQPLDICGRFYQFLGYSQSSLRSHTAWFVAPFAREDDDDLDDMLRDDDLNDDELPDFVDAEIIRNTLGDFRKLAHQPTLYGARLSQGFTSSRASVSLGAEAIITIPDIVTRDDIGAVVTNHTDGAGTMSTELRDMIWSSLLKAGHQRDRNGRPPDVFQIRLGGYKGIIVRDDRLQGCVLGLRPSQNKFKAYFDNENEKVFELAIAESFTRPGPLNLNRPLVSALEDLGIDKSIFVRLQADAMQQLYDKRATFDGAVDIMTRYSLGGGTRMNRLYTAIGQLNAFHELLTEEPFLCAAMDVITAHALKDFKTAARIPLPNCYNLVGVPDQDDYLEPDEIYIAIQEPGGPLVHLRGRFAITRSPTLDAGDLRVVTAVGRLPPSDPPLRIAGLVNCVVLSTQGQRSIASMMGGGDLDGDLYNIITLPELVPTRMIEPRKHTATPALRLQNACTIDNVAQCFASFIEHDNVGLIATSHLRLADSSPLHGEDPICKELADLYSTAVDFSKTGTAVPLTSIPRMTDQARPDFLRFDVGHTKPSGFYESKRALGELHRAIPEERITIPDLSDKDRAQDSASNALKSLRQYLLADAAAHFGFQPLELSEDLRQIALRHRLAFCHHLHSMAETANFPRRPGSRLSELELFVGTNLARIDRDKRGHRNSITNLQQQVTALVDALESTIGRNLIAGDELAALWACWEEALEANGDDFGIKSYRWICCALIMDVLATIKKHGPQWTADVEIVPPVERVSSVPMTPSTSGTAIPGVTGDLPIQRVPVSAISPLNTTSPVTPSTSTIPNETSSKAASEVSSSPSSSPDSKKKPPIRPPGQPGALLPGQKYHPYYGVQQVAQPDSKQGRKLARQTQAQKLALELARLEAAAVAAAANDEGDIPRPPASVADSEDSAWGSESLSSSTVDDWGQEGWDGQSERSSASSTWIAEKKEPVWAGEAGWREKLPHLDKPTPNPNWVGPSARGGPQGMPFGRPAAPLFHSPRQLQPQSGLRSGQAAARRDNRVNPQGAAFRQVKNGGRPSGVGWSAAPKGPARKPLTSDTAKVPSSPGTSSQSSAGRLPSSYPLPSDSDSDSEAMDTPRAASPVGNQALDNKEKDTEPADPWFGEEEKKEAVSAGPVTPEVKPLTEENVKAVTEAVSPPKPTIGKASMYTALHEGYSDSDSEPESL